MSRPPGLPRVCPALPYCLSSIFSGLAAYVLLSGLHLYTLCRHLSPCNPSHLFGIGSGSHQWHHSAPGNSPISSAGGDLSGGLTPAASSTGSASGATNFHPPPSLLNSGPYNPAAVLPPKVAKRMLNLEFVEMSEISLDDPPSTHSWPTPSPSASTHT